MSAEYAVLIAPSANRVYAREATRLAAAELRWVLEALSGLPAHVAEHTIAGVGYVLVRTDADDHTTRSAIGATSSAWAAFGIEGDLLRPVELPRRQQFPDDLVTIPKYTGKTNEQLTGLLLALTLSASADPWRIVSGRGVVLDPVCGRGTTLSTALMLGLDSIGFDIDGKAIETYAGFLKTWAQTHRLPHTHDFGRLRRNKRTVAHQLSFEVFNDRRAQSEGRGVNLRAYAADTTDLADYLKPSSVDVIVGDLPYGVRHGSHRGQDMDRKPDTLVAAALPSWHRVLRPAGAIGLSFNAKTLRPKLLGSLLNDHGFEVVAGCEQFSHRVDSSIQRDLLIARRLPS